MCIDMRTALLGVDSIGQYLQWLNNKINVSSIESVVCCSYQSVLSFLFLFFFYRLVF